MIGSKVMKPGRGLASIVCDLLVETIGCDAGSQRRHPYEEQNYCCPECCGRLAIQAAQDMKQALSPLGYSA
jgi:uncharacterized protein YlaI